MKTCAACGKVLQGGIQMGGILICRQCEPDISIEVERLRTLEKPINISHIARKKFREEFSAGDYLLRDIPEDLWNRVKHQIVDEKCSLREFILRALTVYLESSGKKNGT